MDREILVYADLAGFQALVGRLWSRSRGGRESATFEYDRGWLGRHERFALEPALDLGPGPQHTPSGHALFGALGDSAPDRWGRMLMRRAERMRALSAMSMLGAVDNESHNYLEMVDAIRQYGSEPVADTRELWRRIVFNVLISNTDDHLRNPGFLYEQGNGWRLSPAYDLNPVPLDVRPRILTLAITLDDATASLGLAFEVAEYFGVSATEARRIAGEVGLAVSRWRDEACRLSIGRGAIDRMASAFEHEDQRLAMRGPAL